MTLQQKRMDELCRWAMWHLDDDDLTTCPKVGYLGYANGFTPAEEASVRIIANAMRKKGIDYLDYFKWNVDSSG